MECDVCSRNQTSQLPFYCVTCTRNVLYEPRIDYSRILLEKGDVESRITQAICKEEGHAYTKQAPGPSLRFAAEKVTAEKIRSDQAVQGISAHMEVLRNEIKSAKLEISSRKTALARRRSTTQAVQQTVDRRRERTLEGLNAQEAKSEQAWSSKYKRIQQDRAFLCKEVARLYGLKSIRKIRKGVASEQYSIGGVVIPDLREINNIRPEEVSAAIANVAHLVLLTSHYLAIRLPAEINVPHRAHPRPTIFTPASSYTQEPNHPIATRKSQSTSTSPTTSRHGENKSLARPRTLFIEKRLPQLAQEDSAAYGLFIEGVCLLAWDIAWLCRSQGQTSGTESWEDICCLGRNLWQLFGSNESALALARSNRDSRVRQKLAATNGGAPPLGSRLPSKLGQYSHDSAHSFLPASNGLDIVRGWKFVRHSSIAVHLKRTLIGEL